MGIQPHSHKGLDSPQINASDLIGPSVITSDLLVSSRSVQPSVIQRGTYTLAAGVKLIAFPQVYTTATNLQVLISSNTANQQFLQGVVVSAFTVSGSGTDTGRWLSIGYK